MTIRFPGISMISLPGKSWRQRLAWIPTTLKVLSMILLTVAIARPQKNTESVVTSREGIAIQMLMDISSSMDIELHSGTNRLNRISASKQVFKEFIQGNGNDLRGRPDDTIGLITFARYANTASPMTSCLEALISIVDELEIESRPNEDGTAYGDALMLGAARLVNSDKLLVSHPSQSNPNPVKSKIMILLTDGENNCGRHLPMEAAAYAIKWNIRIYALFIGNKQDSLETVTDLNASQKTLAKICESTGGICRTVYDYDSLKNVYAEIDNLEKSDLKVFAENVFKDYYHHFGLMALIALSIAIIADSTLLRKAP